MADNSPACLRIICMLLCYELQSHRAAADLTGSDCISGCLSVCMSMTERDVNNIINALQTFKPLNGAEAGRPAVHSSAFCSAQLLFVSTCRLLHIKGSYVSRNTLSYVLSRENG